MKTPRLSLLPLLLASAILPGRAPAQDNPPAPNADDPAYAPLKAFLGNWTAEVTYQGKKSVATETYESLCNGLFYKSIVIGTFDGKPFHGVSIWSYDPQAKHYENVWADSMSPAAALTTATYDPKTKSWASTTKMGPITTRGELKWQGADSFTETSYMNQDGKEVVHMVVTRKRAQPGAAPLTDPAGIKTKNATGAAEKTSVAVASTAQAASPAHARLLECVGKWDCVMKLPSPDGSMAESKASEVNSAACGGLWVWSDFKAPEFMGQPFEGHGLVGYDPDAKRYVNYWVDSMSPYITTLTGTYDEKTKTLTASGMSRDAAGAEMPMKESTTWKGDHSRVANFEFGTGEQTMKMELHYTRSQEVPSHKIK